MIYPQQNYTPQVVNSGAYPNTIKRTEIIHVNGQNGAQAFQMMPNSQALLLDDTAPIVWLAQTDGAGYKTVTPYSITPYQPEPEIDLKEIDKRLTKIEEVISNAKSNASSSGKKQSSNKQSQPD